jgi:hypothetical protein
MKSVWGMRWLLIVSVILLGIYAGARIFVFYKVRSAIETQFAALERKGIYVHYNTIETNAWKGSIRITELEIKFPGSDSVCAASASIPEIYGEGLSIIPLVLEKKLLFTSAFVNYPSLHSANNFRMKKGPRRHTGPIQQVSFGRLRIESGSMEITDSISCARRFNANLNALFHNLSLNKPGLDSMKWTVGDSKAWNIAIDLPLHYSKMTISKIAYTSKNELVTLDSMRVAPVIKRLEFARRIKKQSDQFTCFMPSLRALGVVLGPPSAPAVHARSVALKFNLMVYRDKRFPRVWRKPRVMPVRFLRGLPFHLQIDSVQIEPSFVSYEEHPEKGEGTGKIFFKELRATIGNLSNDSVADTRMHVESKFMESGDLRADFTFPLTAKKPYTVTGELNNFSMPQVNPMLVPIGNVKIESGRMKNMKFKFHYNDFVSNGELEVNYSDLKVVSLRHDDRRKTNKIVSLIIGVFVKKDKNEKDTKDERTGPIHWERDSQKGILNYWWKSVLTGIKAVYNLDKLMGDKSKDKEKEILKLKEKDKVSAKR